MDSFISSGGGQAPDKLRQMRRALQFTAGIARALQADYAALWGANAADVKGLSPDQLALAENFRFKLGDFLVSISQAESGLADNPPPGSAEALKLAARFSPDILNARARELQALARQVAATPAVSAYAAASTQPAASPPKPRAQTGPLSPSVGTGRLAAMGTARLGAWLQRVLEPIVSEPIAPPPPPVVSPLKQAFEQARTIVGKVLARTSQELDIVAVSLEGVRLPGLARPQEQIPTALQAAADVAALNPTQRSWLMPLAKRLLIDPLAVQNAAVAVTNYRQAQTLHNEALALTPRLETVTAERVPGVLAAFELGRYRASILPLTHLHLTFKDTPVFQKLFPAPAPAAPAART